MTNQELFDKVTNHLLTQNELALSNGNCAYRAKNEQGKVLMCAIGCLIPDDKYDTEMEGKLWNYLDKTTGVLRDIGISAMDDKTIKLLHALQDVHDYHDPLVWPQTLKGLAGIHNLEYHGTSL